MGSQINLPAIYIANLMGLIILFVVMTANSWRITSRTRDNFYLRIMVVIAILASISDPVAYSLDGIPGLSVHVIVYVSNLMIYLSNLTLGLAWMYFILSYINVRMAKWHRNIVLICNAVGVGLLIVNIFYPLVFKVDSANVYSRNAFYLYFMIMEILMLADGVALYFHARYKSGKMKFFPVWACVIPVAIGMLIQYFFYGLSTTWPFICVGVGGVVFSLQNDQMFRDRLTGIYNRSYLDVVKTRTYSAKNRHALTAMMLDLNDFKSINDTYGHAVGDDALINTAVMLTEAVGSLGEVIRYAGDEFIILLNTQDDLKIQRVIDDIRSNFERFNESGKKKYSICASIGYTKLLLDEYSMDELLDVTDKKMYDDKKMYYMKNDKLKRRS